MPSDQYLRASYRREDLKTDRTERHVASYARVRFARVSPRKARLLADLIRGLQVDQALNVLKFTHRPSAGPIVERLLKSAMANVNRAERLDPKVLFVGRVWVDGAGMLKRFRPRAFGRAARVRKRLCHISMELVAQS